MIAEADIVKMTKAERVDAINLIWASLDRDDLEPPDWHKDVLAERMREIESGTATFISVEELTRRFDALRDERTGNQ
jgi:hypothetical protein